MENSPILTQKERLAIPRQKMPEQAPEIRKRNFNEVNLGFDEETAVLEANRCLDCPRPTCIEGCPVQIKIPDFIRMITQRDFLGAAKKIKEDNLLPSVCGRVCPQEQQCEKTCVLHGKFQPISIGRLERFVADYERKSGIFTPPAILPPNGKKIAIVGSGPSGLACASDLVQWGYDVTILEALHELGGVLVYGIPEFRLPKEILSYEINNLKKIGVKFVNNFIVGKMLTIDELMDEEGFDAVYLSVGAGLPWFLNIPGENLMGVYSANEFLTRINLMKAYQFPDADTPIHIGKNAVVIGGGNTAMDAVRTAMRIGAETATIVYRRSEVEMPARIEEIHHAKEEGIVFRMLTNPVEFISDENGWVKSVRNVRMELGEPDSSGRRRPIPIPGSEFDIEADLVVVAIGNGSNPLISQTTPDLKCNKRGNILVSGTSGRTSKRGVFAGGDIVSGGATVILAMGEGRNAAKSIDEFIKTGDWDDNSPIAQSMP
ncbi:MAG: glutamate synthase (NADPH), homotetrameric [Candidatus Marinimicrobia bacterium CG08_land_8_20_14_0_20_45_22]|nr:MAG: glutamate synthase (NADPH), homotetrameric [Candidatus Marinimicrobia bacterium CG08_land_8_20_14_0_20_45_22]